MAKHCVTEECWACCTSHPGHSPDSGLLLWLLLTAALGDIIDNYLILLPPHPLLNKLRLLHSN